MKKTELDWMFWSGKKKKLRILNPDDFQVPTIVGTNMRKMFGEDFVASLGLADENEIVSRNELMRFLFERPELRQKIRNWKKDGYLTESLPKDENSFLYYYENDNPYWAAVKEFLGEVKNTEKCPTKIIPFLDKIEKSVVTLESLEKNMAEKIGEKLRKVTRMEGVIDLTVEGSQMKIRELSNEDDYVPTIIGQKAFSAAWSTSYMAHIPRWLGKWFWRVTGIKKLAQSIANYRASAKAKRSAIIEFFPNSIKTDLMNGLRGLLKLKLLFINMEDKDLSEEENKIKKFLTSMPSTFFKMYFSYDENGLQITPVSIQNVNRPEFSTFSERRARDRYTGYNEKERKTIIQNLEKINQDVSEGFAVQNALKTSEFIANNFGLLIGESKKIAATNTDEDFRWYYIQNLYNSSEHNEVYKKLIANRKYFWSGLDELDNLCRIIDLFESQAKRYSLPLCMPNIKTKKVGVNFKAMAPIDMMDQGKKMVPFSFPEINGHILCLTGKHGRGKSVAGKSVLENLWLAQSGLLVFAESFSTDIKEMIGAVTNDTGDGSTATVFVKKTMNLFKNIKKVPAHKSLIFIDEIGKGTQESSGLELGQKILKALNQNGNSVIFNTQIIKLAEHARDNFQAICLKVDDKHQFQPGIGEGLMEELIHEVGLDKYLN